MLVLCLLQFVAYTVGSIVFSTIDYIIDYTPDFISKRYPDIAKIKRLQERPSKNVWKEYGMIFPVMIQNEILITIPFIYFAGCMLDSYGYFNTYHWVSDPYIDFYIPWLSKHGNWGMVSYHLQMISKLFKCIIIEDILFYIVHRIFHIQIMYQYFHKIHHQLVSPVSIGSFYVHPVEHFLCNLCPIFYPSCVQE